MYDKIDFIMKNPVVTVNINDSVEKVDGILISHNLTCVPVVDDSGKCFGIISLPDMQLFLSKKGNKDTVKSWEICTHKILEVGLDATVRQVAELMTKNHVHHIIVTSNGVIVGMVSTIDIIQHYLLA